MGRGIDVLRKAVAGAERPGHKYIRRVPKSGGGYEYVYSEAGSAVPRVAGSKMSERSPAFWRERHAEAAKRGMTLWTKGESGMHYVARGDEDQYKREGWTPAPHKPEAGTGKYKPGYSPEELGKESVFSGAFTPVGAPYSSKGAAALAMDTLKRNSNGKHKFQYKETPRGFQIFAKRAGHKTSTAIEPITTKPLGPKPGAPPKLTTAEENYRGRRDPMMRAYFDYSPAGKAAPEFELYGSKVGTKDGLRALHFRDDRWFSPEDAATMFQSAGVRRHEKFRPKVLLKLSQLDPKAEVQIAREYSPTVYVKTSASVEDIERLHTGADEVDKQADGTIRLWWD